MWEVSQTPANYFPPNDEKWCIISEDGDIHNFYLTREAAESALIILLGK